MKKLFSLILSISVIFSSTVTVFAAGILPSTSEDTIIVTKKIYFDEMTRLSFENSQDTNFRLIISPVVTLYRIPKWRVYDVKLIDSEWTNFNKKLSVFKVQNGSKIAVSVATSVNSSFSANVSVPTSIVTTGVGFNVSTGHSVTGYAEDEIPKGHRLAAARAYPIYEVSSFKAELVKLDTGEVVRRGEGKAYLPVGAEVVFEFKRA